MDRGKRPVGRKKNVTAGGGNARRRGDGLHMGGPVGKADGYQERHDGQTGEEKGLNLGGGIGNMVEQAAMEELGSALTGRKRGGGLGKILLLVAVLLLGGGAGIGGLLGGGSTGVPEDHSLLQGNTNGSFGSALSDFTGQSSAAATGNSGVLNTLVAQEARPKRVMPVGGGQDKVTIMVYMCGTDLESKYGMATSDLTEMAKANISDKINLLVYTGGCEKWQNQVVSSQTNQIYQVKDGGLLPLERDLGSHPMTDPDTLSGYIRYGKKHYPADRYALIFWDHGGGSISGYGYDQLYANRGSMTLDKISQALEDGDCTFDFVGFDACLMASLETAMVVEPYADYLIASEETEPGVGWYYTNWLSALSENTSMSTLELGQKIADDFVDVCAQKTPRDQTTLSVVDLAELKGTVPQTFNDFAKSANGMIRDKEYQKIANARSTTKEFARSAGIDQVDLIHLADNVDTKESRRLSEALKSCVKYNRTSRNMDHAYGISVYFPLEKLSNVDRMVSTYKKIGLDNEYTKCVSSFASLETGGQIASGSNGSPFGSLFGSMLSGGQSSDMASQLLQTFLQGGISNISGLGSGKMNFVDRDLLDGQTEYLTENLLDSSDLIWKEGDAGYVLELSKEQWELIQNLELNVFLDDGEGYIDLGLDNVYEFDDSGDLMGSYDGTWLAINGQVVSYYMMEQESDGETYRITGRVPAMLNNERVELILNFTSENPNGEVAGARKVYDQGETDTLSKGLIPIEEGDQLDFLCDYYTYDEEFQDNYYLGEPLYVNGELTISNVRVGEEVCVASYRITDIYQNHFWTPEIPG
ncbi:MAG: clostripain-related cysteine peptidase [Blautia sp.]